MFDSRRRRRARRSDLLIATSCIMQADVMLRRSPWQCRYLPASAAISNLCFNILVFDLFASWNLFAAMCRPVTNTYGDSDVISMPAGFRRHLVGKTLINVFTVIKKVKFSHTRYRALGPELIPVYRQSARRWREVNHIYSAVVCRCFLPGLRLPP